jgi:hypothetical protein
MLSSTSPWQPRSEGRAATRLLFPRAPSALHRRLAEGAWRGPNRFRRLSRLCSSVRLSRYTWQTSRPLAQKTRKPVIFPCSPHDAGGGAAPLSAFAVQAHGRKGMGTRWQTIARPLAACRRAGIGRARWRNARGVLPLVRVTCRWPRARGAWPRRVRRGRRRVGSGG